MRGIQVRIALAFLILALALPGLLAAQEMSWFINDGPDSQYLWEDLSIGSFWEWMAPDAIEQGDVAARLNGPPAHEGFRRLL